MAVMGFFLGACAPKVGCPSNAVGAEKIAAGDSKALKASKSKYKGNKAY